MLEIFLLNISRCSGDVKELTLAPEARFLLSPTHACHVKLEQRLLAYCVARVHR